VARALIVGCGCRGRGLGERLIAAGWAIRGTTRDRQCAELIEAAGIDAAVADPGRPGTVLDLVADVAVVHWLLGSAEAEPEATAAIHGARLERLLEKLVDSPVRGFVYEGAGTVEQKYLSAGAEVAQRAADTWRIPVRVVEQDPSDYQAWLNAMARATADVLTSNEEREARSR
jgi:nucleoside-diphosphate-sugar epimerase